MIIWPEGHWDKPDKYGIIDEKAQDNKTGKRRDEAFPGEWDEGVLADTDEELSDYEFFDYKVRPDEPDEWWRQFKWAKVDCDEENDLADKHNIAQWPTFQFVDHETGEIKCEMHGYSEERLIAWLKDPKDDKIDCPSAPEPLPPNDEDEDEEEEEKPAEDKPAEDKPAEVD